MKQINQERYEEYLFLFSDACAVSDKEVSLL